MESDLISIIVPVYNVEQYVERCLRSILNQTYNNLEIMLVNDGSRDNSGLICKKYAEKDSRIIYIEQVNQGQSSARNSALDCIKGKYVCFVDSDDWIDPSFVSELYDSIKNNNKQIAVCSYSISDDKVDNAINLPINENVISACEFKSLIIPNKIENFVWNKIFKKDFITDVRFKKGIYYEDIVFFNDLLPYLTSNVGIVNKPLYHYYMRSNSTVHNRSLKRELDYFNALKSRYELDYVDKNAKVEILKHLLTSFYYFYQIKDFNQDVVDNCKNYIKKAPNYLFAKAKKLLTKKELLRFLLAFYCPIVYRTLFNIYRFIEKIRGNK